MQLKALTALFIGLLISAATFATPVKPQPIPYHSYDPIAAIYGYPVVSTNGLSGKWIAAGSPFIQFQLIMSGVEPTQAQVYLSVTYYNSWLMSPSSTTTINVLLIYVNAGQQIGGTNYYTSTQFYGIASYTVLEIDNQ